MDSRSIHITSLLDSNVGFEVKYISKLQTIEDAHKLSMPVGRDRNISGFFCKYACDTILERNSIDYSEVFYFDPVQIRQLAGLQ